MGPTPVTDILMRRGKLDIDAERKMPCEDRKPMEQLPQADRGRDWSDVFTSQGAPGIACNPQTLGRGETGSFPGAFRENMALPSP